MRLLEKKIRTRSFTYWNYKFESTLIRIRERDTEGPLAKAFNNVARDHLSSEIAKLFYSASLSFNVVRNPYFVGAFTYVANTSISGYLRMAIMR